MKLSTLQMVFTGNFAKLVIYVNNTPGYSCVAGEVWRPPEMAEIYAKRGVGIRDSQHCKKLAGDLLVWKNGVLQETTEAHRNFGIYWKSLNPQNRWGGDWDGDGEVDPGDNDGNHYEMREAKG